jgi:hypothetical protein
MVDDVEQQGYFSLLRWRADATRDEARNIAVILVDADRRAAQMKAAPPSTMSPRLREQGILDSFLVGLEEQLSGGVGVEELFALHRSLERSLVATEPRPVAIGDPEQTLVSLYRAAWHRPHEGEVPQRRPLLLIESSAISVAKESRRRGVSTWTTSTSTSLSPSSA